MSRCAEADSLPRGRVLRSMPRSRALSQGGAGCGSNRADLYRHRVQGGTEQPLTYPDMRLPIASSDRVNRRYESKRVVIDQLTSGFKVAAPCRRNNDFKEVALVSGELDVWHLRLLCRRDLRIPTSLL